jgi:hypothetical protein
MGSWLSYGLGKLNANLPSFVVLNGGLIPPGGLDNFNAGFLPAARRGSVFKTGANPVANIKRLERSEDTQRKKLDLVRKLDRLIRRPLRTLRMPSAIGHHQSRNRFSDAIGRSRIDGHCR